MIDRRTIAAIATCVAVAVGIFGSCVDPNVQSQGTQAPRPAADQPIVLDEGSAPAAQPVALHANKTGSVYTDRFAALWNDIHNPANAVEVDAYLKGGKPPVFKYHRLWAQADIAIANASYGWLFPDDANETKAAGPARAGAGRAHSSRSKKTKK